MTEKKKKTSEAGGGAAGTPAPGEGKVEPAAPSQTPKAGPPAGTGKKKGGEPGAGLKEAKQGSDAVAGPKESKKEGEAVAGPKEAKKRGSEAPAEAKEKRKADKPKDMKAEAVPEEPAPPPRLRVMYQSEVRERLRQKFNLRNTHQVPQLRKITVNMGVGKAIENRKRLDAAMEDLAAITGQKPKLCTATKSEANFKLRQGMPIGCKVDLRGARMYEFFDRLVSVAIPRIRDFRGINRNSFDGRGNFSMGLAEQIVFPEVPLDKVEFSQGMDITMAISGGSDEMSLELLENLGMPFKRV
jgi:large subunit ribosomal protein L5